MLLELHASLKPGGVLFSSNTHGHNEEGWNGGRYGVYHDLDTWRSYLSAADSLRLITITARRTAGKNRLVSERIASEDLECGRGSSVARS